MTDDQLQTLIELEGYRITLQTEAYALRKVASELSKYVKELTYECEPLHSQIEYPYSR